MWRTLQLVLFVLGLLLVWGGEKLSIPFLQYGGIACLGLAAMAIGWEAIVTRHIVVGSRRSGTRGTYTGIAAIFQGVQFNVIGLFLFVVSAMVYVKANGRAVFLQMVRHPGLPLIVFGSLILMQAVITLVGSLELRQGARWEVILNLLVSRMLPGIILVVIGLGAVGLGLFEVVAPAAFDARGGGFLEMLYGLR